MGVMWSHFEQHEAIKCIVSNQNFLNPHPPLTAHQSIFAKENEDENGYTIHKAREHGHKETGAP
jgi:hypothetical protein